MVAIARGICKKPAPRMPRHSGYNRDMPKSSSSIPWPAVALVIVIAFAAGIGLSYLQGQRGESTQVEGLLWPDPPVLPSINLLDQDGAPFTQEQLRGKWSLLFFGFTHCPDICPTTLDQMARAHGALERNAHYAGRGQVVLVSLDPERDTPAILHDYVKYFHKDFLAVTASLEELSALTRAMGVLFMKVSQPGDSYSIDHSAGIFFVDPALRLVSVLTPPHNAAAIVRRFAAVSAFIEP